MNPKAQIQKWPNGPNHPNFGFKKGNHSSKERRSPQPTTPYGLLAPQPRLRLCMLAYSPRTCATHTTYLQEETNTTANTKNRKKCIFLFFFSAIKPRDLIFVRGYAHWILKKSSQKLLKGDFQICFFVSFDGLCNFSMNT
ncbi:hypothetical protein V6Z11_A05G388500 [Gossypium hirsutum]